MLLFHCAVYQTVFHFKCFFTAVLIILSPVNSTALSQTQRTASFFVFSFFAELPVGFWSGIALHWLTKGQPKQSVDSCRRLICVKLLRPATEQCRGFTAENSALVRKITVGCWQSLSDESSFVSNCDKEFVDEVSPSHTRTQITSIDRWTYCSFRC